MNYSRETNNRTLFQEYSRSSTSSSYLQERARHKQPIFFQFRHNPLLKNDLRLIVWFGVEVSFGSASSSPFSPSRGKSSKIPIVGILRKLPRRESVQVTRSQQIAGLSKHRCPVVFIFRDNTAVLKKPPCNFSFVAFFFFFARRRNSVCITVTIWL